MHKIISTLIILFLASLLTKAQTVTDPDETAGLLHQNGQIYLVVLVLITIFAGIIFYLIRLDKKITQLEKNI